MLLLALILISLFNLWFLTSQAPTPDLDLKIETLKTELKQEIQKEIKNIPQNTQFVPVPGTNGLNGINGSNGKDGLSGTNGVSGNNGTNGKDGEQGIPGREIELRVNPKNGNLEWRYVGELSWIRLLKKCEIQSTCEVK